MSNNEIEFIFKNENYYRNIIKCFFLESKKPKDNFIEVNNNVHGNSIEKYYLDKFENEEYKKAQNIIKAIEQTKNVLTDRQNLIYNFRYRQMETIESIAFKLHYSNSLIKKELVKIKREFNKQYLLLLI